MLRCDQELVRYFQSKWHFMSSHFFCSVFVGTKGCSKELLHSYMKDRALKSSHSALFQVTGGDLHLTPNTCSFEPGRMQEEKTLN